MLYEKGILYKLVSGNLATWGEMLSKFHQIQAKFTKYILITFTYCLFVTETSRNLCFVTCFNMKIRFMKHETKFHNRILYNKCSYIFLYVDMGIIGKLGTIFINHHKTIINIWCSLVNLGNFKEKYIGLRKKSSMYMY